MEHAPLWWLVSAIGYGVVSCAVICRASTDPALVVAWILALPLLLALSVVDVASQRLPDHLTWPALICAAGAAVCVEAFRFVPRSAARGGHGRLWYLALDVAWVVGGAMLLTGVYFVLCLASSGHGMGLGDVKLAPTLGIFAAAGGKGDWVEALVFPFLLGGAWALLLLVRRRSLSTRMPFGPFMILGAGLALAA